MMDGYGRKLKWESDGIGRVRVFSLGRDGIVGGTGDDADTEVEFNSPSSS